MYKVKIETTTPSNMTSVMTIESLEELGVKVEDSIKIIVKTVNILLVKE